MNQYPLLKFREKKTDNPEKIPDNPGKNPIHQDFPKNPIIPIIPITRYDFPIIKTFGKSIPNRNQHTPWTSSTARKAPARSPVAAGPPAANPPSDAPGTMTAPYDAQASIAAGASNTKVATV